VFQVKYVVEFARALAMMPEVYRVDLLTRQICSPDVDSSYGEPTEMLTSGTYDGGQELGESSGAYIIRIPCGPRLLPSECFRTFIFQTLINFPVLCLISIPTTKSLQPSPLLLIQGQIYPEGALMALHSGVF
jgi:hypothetical protein